MTMVRLSLVPAALVVLASVANAECKLAPGRNDRDTFLSRCSQAGGTVRQASNGNLVCDCPDKSGSASGSAGSAEADFVRGAFDLGVAVNQWLGGMERQARERRAARERARVAAEIARREQFVRDSIAAAQAREATWQRLNSQLRLSAAPQLEMRLGSPATEIGFRFDGEGERRNLSNAELAARNTTACTFMASCGEKTVMPELGDPMVVDLRHLKRATHLLRQTLYAPAEERESALDVATQIIEGQGPEFDVPADAPELSSEAGREIGAAVSDRKAATAERMERAAAVATLDERRAFLNDVIELARSDQSLSAAERAQLLAELARQLSALDSALADARLAHERAKAAEQRASQVERSELLRVARGQPRPTQPNADAGTVDLRPLGDRALKAVVDPRVLSNNPIVKREQALLDRDPEAWYAAAGQRVQAATDENRRWAQVLERAIREGPTSSTARFANWATFKEYGFDPALDSALVSAVKEAYPDLDPAADRRLLRAIAEAEITRFLTNSDNGEGLYEAPLESDDLLKLFQGRGDESVLSPDYDLLKIFQQPPEARTPAEATVTRRIVAALRLDTVKPSDAPWGRDVLESLRTPASRRATADELIGEGILRQMAAEEAQNNPPPAFIPLAGLNPGDVVLVAPASAQRDVAGAVSGGVIQAGDYLRRVATDFAEGGLARAVATEAQPASHAIAYVGVVDGRMLFLNHAPGRPSEIVDYRQVLAEYGGREMFVARPQLPVDGRALWQAAREQVDYGVVGNRVVCSERAGLAIARATGASLTNDRLGPLDITPGDFFDRENNVGKHFVVTRLRITGVPRRNQP